MGLLRCPEAAHASLPSACDAPVSTWGSACPQAPGTSLGALPALCGVTLWAGLGLLPSVDVSFWRPCWVILQPQDPSVFFFWYKFIYFWLHWVFVAARGPSLVAASGGYSSLRCVGFSLQWLLLLQSTGSRHVAFSSCGTWASVVVARGL